MSEIAEAAGDAGVAYAYKPSVMGGSYAFRVAPDALHWEVGRHSGSLAYTSIRRIRLSYRPITLANYRFVAEIWADGLPKLMVASTSWRSIVEQARLDADYVAFIRALHACIHEAGGRPELITGSSPFVYWPGVAAMALMIVTVPIVIWRTLREGAIGAGLLITAFMAYCFWQIGFFFYRNRPGRYALDALPPHVLPRE